MLRKAISWLMLFISIWWLYFAIQQSAAGMLPLSLQLQSLIGPLFILMVSLVACLSVASKKIMNGILDIFKWSVGHQWLIFGFFCCYQFCCIFLLGGTKFGWDPSAIITQLQPTPYASQYFSKFPNNLTLYFIAVFFSQLLGLSDQFQFTQFFQFFNCFLINMSLLWLFSISKRIVSRSVASAIFLLSVFIFALSGWFLVPYTDTIPLPLAVGIIDIVVRLYQHVVELERFETQSTSSSMRLIFSLSFFLGIITGLAYFMKPSLVIPVIAFWILFSLSIDKKRFIRILIVLIVLFGIGFNTITIPVNTLEKQQDYVRIDPEESFPATHFVMMGMTGNGGYSDADFQDTSKQPNHQAKVHRNLQVISERLSDFGFMGYIRFIMEKAQNYLADGSFGWGVDAGNHFIQFRPISNLPFYDAQMSRVAVRIRTLYTPRTSLNNSMRQILQLVYIFLILGIFFSSYYLIVKSGIKKSIIMSHSECDQFVGVWLSLSLIGAIIFLSLFESGRSRYLLQFFPEIFIVSSMGWDKFRNYRRNC